MNIVTAVKLRPGNSLVSLWLGLSVAAFMHCAAPGVSAAKKDSLKPAELFALTNVYTAHFQFTAEQWDAMEPESGASVFGGPRNGARPNAAAPINARGPRGGGPAFGPGMFLAPAFLQAGDTDKDGKVTKPEFEELAGRWFTSWDKDKSGKLDTDKLRDGLSASLAGGGPGGGIPRINLQGTEGKRNGLASAMGVEFDYVKANLEFAGRKFTNVAVRYKGNGTWMMSQGSKKRSLKVDLNEFVKGQKIAGVTKLNFHNVITDAGWMNEVLSHQFFRDAGVGAPRTAYARVYITVPGQYDKEYFGLYSLVENIDDNFLDERFGTSKGALFKPVTSDLFADLGDDWAKYQQTYDPKDAPAAADSQRVIDLAKLVSHGTDEDFAAKLPTFLDLEQFSRFMAGTVWLCSLDSILGPGQNYYMYLDPKTRKFQFFPWDLDHSFGQFFLMGDQHQRNELSIHKPWRGENRFLARVFKVQAFKERYLAQLKEINETIGRPERITTQVDQVAAAIRPAIKEESGEKLATFDKSVAGESVEPANFGPGGPGGRRGGPGGPPPMTMPVQPIKKFVVERSKSIEAQLGGKSKGSDIDAPPPGMARNFGPGMFLGPAIQAKFDSDKNGNLSREELVAGFSKWFSSWDTEKSGTLNEEQLRAAFNKEFAFPGPGGPGGGGPGPGRPPE